LVDLNPRNAYQQTLPSKFVGCFPGTQFCIKGVIVLIQTISKAYEDITTGPNKPGYSNSSITKFINSAAGFCYGLSPPRKLFKLLGTYRTANGRKMVDWWEELRWARTIL